MCLRTLLWLNPLLVYVHTSLTKLGCHLDWYTWFIYSWLSFGDQSLQRQVNIMLHYRTSVIPMTCWLRWHRTVFLQSITGSYQLKCPFEACTIIRWPAVHYTVEPWLGLIFSLVTTWNKDRALPVSLPDRCSSVLWVENAISCAVSPWRRLNHFGET